MFNTGCLVIHKRPSLLNIRHIHCTILCADDCFGGLATLRLAQPSYWFSSCLTFQNCNVITCHTQACWKPSAKGTVVAPYHPKKTTHSTGRSGQALVLTGLLLSMSHLHTYTHIKTDGDMYTPPQRMHERREPWAASSISVKGLLHRDMKFWG